MDYNKLFKTTAVAARSLALLGEDAINKVLLLLSERIVVREKEILASNAEDLERMSCDDPKYDRLKLTSQRIQGIASDMVNVAALPSPLGRVLETTVRPNGLKLQKVSVPFGVIGVIFEARPNVTLDVFSLCLKSGNACILKGGHDAESTNLAVMKIIHEVLEELGVNPHIVELLPSTREAAAELLHANDFVDLVIPRGSSALIRYVRQEATVPVIETGAGVCHTYFDRYGDVVKGAAIIHNAKTRRVSVCNALDCLLVHKEVAHHLTDLCAPLSAEHVIVYADERAMAVLSDSYPKDLLKPATSESYGTEFLDYKMAVRVVDSVDEALDHIYTYSSKHSECIVTEDASVARMFTQSVDAACVYVNAPTSFTDGAQFGLGAEVGISTQKLHARGPMGIRELTSYKWIIEGNGQTRP